MALDNHGKGALPESKQHFLDLDRVSAIDLRRIIDRAGEIKQARQGQAKAVPDADAPLAGKMIALIFEKPSTRTRASFDVGMRQLGGETMVLTGAEMQLGRGETVADTARVLSRYVDAMMIRTYSPHMLEEMAAAATIPVINGLTDHSHPCQIMADILTFEEHCGPIRGKKLTWSGDGNNVCTSFIHAAPQFGFELAVTCPETLDPDAGAVAWARAQGASVTIERDPVKAVAGAHAVITDCWLSMHDSDETRERRHNQLKPYQVNAGLMQHADPSAVVMHCLPAHREEEITSEVFDGPQSVVFDEAENRLHAQKAIIRYCMGCL